MMADASDDSSDASDALAHALISSLPMAHLFRRGGNRRDHLFAMEQDSQFVHVFTSDQQHDSVASVHNKITARHVSRSSVTGRS